MEVPVKFVVGDLDMVHTTPGAKEFVNNGGFKHHVPLLEEVVEMEGVGHFINQEKAEEINNHIMTTLAYTDLFSCRSRTHPEPYSATLHALGSPLNRRTRFQSTRLSN